MLILININISNCPVAIFFSSYLFFRKLAIFCPVTILFFVVTISSGHLFTTEAHITPPVNSPSSHLESGYFTMIVAKFATGITDRPKVGGRGHWAVYYTSSQCFILTFYYSLALQLLGVLINFDWLVH